MFHFPKLDYLYYDTMDDYDTNFPLYVASQRLEDVGKKVIIVQVTEQPLVTTKTLSFRNRSILYIPKVDSKGVKLPYFQTDYKPGALDHDITPIVYNFEAYANGINILKRSPQLNTNAGVNLLDYCYINSCIGTITNVNRDIYTAFTSTHSTLWHGGFTLVRSMTEPNATEGLLIENNVFLENVDIRFEIAKFDTAVPSNINMMANLGDVVIDNLANGHALIYNDVAKSWINGVAGGGGLGLPPHNLDSHTDVTISSSAGSGQILTQGATDWVNTPEIAVNPISRNVAIAGSGVTTISGTGLTQTFVDGLNANMTFGMISPANVGKIRFTAGTPATSYVSIVPATGETAPTLYTKILANDDAVVNTGALNSRIAAIPTDDTKATLGGDAIGSDIVLGSTDAQPTRLIAQSDTFLSATGGGAPLSSVALGSTNFSTVGVTSSGAINLTAGSVLGTFSFPEGLDINTGGQKLRIVSAQLGVTSYPTTTTISGTPSVYSSRIRNVTNGSADAIPNRQYVDEEIATRAAASHVHSGADITSGTVAVARLPTAIPADSISTGVVSNAEFDTLDGVTSSIQTQLNGKASITHVHSGADITSGTVTVARLPTAIPATSISTGIVSNTEFDFLDGVTSPVVGTTQTQILTNKTLVDSTTFFADDIAPTKRVQFQLANLTAGLTRVFQFPDVASGTLVTDTTAVVNGGNSFGGGLMSIGANDANTLALKANNTFRMWFQNNQLEQNPFGANSTFTNAIQLSIAGDGPTMLYGPYSNLGPVSHMLIQAPGGNGQNGGNLTLRAGGVVGGGQPGAMFLETGKAIFNGGSASGLITVRTANCESSPISTSGAITLSTGESGLSSGAVTINTGSSGASTLGPSTGNILLFTGNTGINTAATGSVGNISILCGAANTATGIARNGGSINIAASRGNQGGSNGDVNLYTQFSSAAGVTVASVDTGRRAILNAGTISASTTRTFTFQDQTGVLALLSDLDRSRTYAAMEGNVVPSLGILNNVNWIQGALTAVSLKDFTATANNSFTYTGVDTKFFDVQYSALPLTTSNDRTVKIYCYKNTLATLLNPAIGNRVLGSGSTSISRTAVDDTTGMAGSFGVSLTTNDVLRFYCVNVENSDIITVSDFSVCIKRVN